MTRLNSGNKYGAKYTWSQLCNRTFASRAEAVRGEELRLMEMAGEITELNYQPWFVLCKKPKITITLDFYYKVDGLVKFEDVKGVLTRDSRTKLAWLKEKHGIDVRLIR